MENALSTYLVCLELGNHRREMSQCVVFGGLKCIKQVVKTKRFDVAMKHNIQLKKLMNTYVILMRFHSLLFNKKRFKKKNLWWKKKKMPLRIKVYTFSSIES
ncbi:uncharacterized protein LOC122195510 isoform X2 [Lactuca sativa]|uniref:uncharacterized protein LOC122195510 isoform X2 n=1 Tax=Lactuca sativa TaxID=4236 RepID=UPI000CAFF067|nr:uncharacterized protein LOC122195510 isoform X2 [Lactuca sativa]